jgi:hypothetical protein
MDILSGCIGVCINVMLYLFCIGVGGAIEWLVPPLFELFKTEKCLIFNFLLVPLIGGKSLSFGTTD